MWFCFERIKGNAYFIFTVNWDSNVLKVMNNKIWNGEQDAK